MSKIFNMSNKLSLVCIILIFLDNTESQGLLNMISYMNPFDSSSSFRETAVTLAGPLQDKKTNHDLNSQTLEIQDDLSFQTAILRIRLKAAKQFIENRTRFLKHTEANDWEINGLLLTFKRKDVEGAKSDIKLIEEALQNPSKFKDLIIHSTSNEKKYEYKIFRY